MARCVHCFESAGNTRDHVFPASWYPQTTSEKVQRPTVPACGRCNGRFGKLEGDLLGRLGLCVDPRKVAAAGIPAIALRAVGVGVESELSTKERDIRASLLARMCGEIVPYSAIEGQPGILPGFGPHTEFPLEPQMAIRIKAEILHEVCEKVIRGLEYYIAKRYVEGPFELKVFFVQETSASNLGVAFGESPLYLGPGFRVQRLPAHDDPKQVLYQIKVWDTLLVHGSIVAVQPKT